MAGYNIVFRQRDFTIAAGITNVKSTLLNTSPPPPNSEIRPGPKNI